MIENLNKKLLFIGGHHNSAIATIDWLKTQYNLEFFWIGKKFVTGDTLTPEFTEVNTRNIPFYNLIAGKLFRASSIFFIPQIIYNLLLIPIGFIQSFYYLGKIRPNLIVSFGGYMAVPVVIAGHFMGIKSVLHEQTASIGLANKISSYFVEKIYTSWPENFYSEENDNIKNKLMYTGLPISEHKIIIETTNEAKYELSELKKTIYITGGKSGSLFFNKTFLEILDNVTENYNLIWSCGRRIGEADFNEIQRAVERLPENKKQNIIIREYFGEEEMSKVLSTADMIVTRGGGHTIYELALVKKPAIVVPIPWSSNQEQLKNAKILEAFGLAVVLDQDEATPYKLLETIQSFSLEIDKIKQTVSGKEFVSTKGQENLGNEILKTLRS